MATALGEGEERQQPAGATGAHERRVVWALLTIATLVAAALRLPFLGHQSLWLDEVFTREIVRESTLPGVWRHVRATESTPPLYYALGWLLHARSTAAMRAIPAVALIAAVPVGYLAFRRLVGTRAALAAAAILAVDPMLVWYSTDARSYGLFVLTALLSVWAFSSVLERACARRFALWAAASVACVWTHYFGVYVVGGEALLLLYARPRARRATVGWVIGVGVCLVPLIPLLISQTGDERAAFIEKSSLARRVLETARQLVAGPNVPRAWLEGAVLLVAYAALALGAWWALRSQRRARPLLALAVIVGVAPLLLAVLGISDRVYARNLIVLVPLLAALAAPAMLRWRAAPLALYLVLAAVTSIWVATDWRYEQTDWRAAIARAEAIDPRAPVVAVTPSSAPVVQAYLARAPVAQPAALVTQRAWVIVEPVRAAGQRALGPAAVPALPGFTAQRTSELHGFQIVLEVAGAPARIRAASVPGATLFPGS